MGCLQGQDAVKLAMREGARRGRVFDRVLVDGVGYAGTKADLDDEVIEWMNSRSENSAPR